jgi:hypothetical protein
MQHAGAIREAGQLFERRGDGADDREHDEAESEDDRTVEDRRRLRTPARADQTYLKLRSEARREDPAERAGL